MAKILLKNLTANFTRSVLMDINMPEMDGYETASGLKNNYPADKSTGLINV